jgi:hypothetical protein
MVNELETEQREGISYNSSIEKLEDTVGGKSSEAERRRELCCVGTERHQSKLKNIRARSWGGGVVSGFGSKVRDMRK